MQHLNEMFLPHGEIGQHVRNLHAAQMGLPAMEAFRRVMHENDYADFVHSMLFAEQRAAEDEGGEDNSN